jgi:DNA-directed RNA polymerase II subunit RPB2
LGDGTPYSHLKIGNLREQLLALGMHPYGNEVMYNGQTGEMMESEIFIGPTFYQRLKHMVVDKKHSRSRGPIVSLTRQPCEGRSRDGGLRVGEMERDCMLSHGLAVFTKERLMDVSDPFRTGFCKSCGTLAVVNPLENVYHCGNCGIKTHFEMKTNPYAVAALKTEWDSLESTRTWDINGVREWADVRKDPGENHVGAVFDICVEKNSELPKEDKSRKRTG